MRGTPPPRCATCNGLLDDDLLVDGGTYCPETGGGEHTVRAATAEEWEEIGYTVDRHCYPWVAYKGPRFEPDIWFPIATPAC